jgi:hypothetical protein
MREPSLDGGETTIIKALGFGGASVAGEVLFERCPGFEEAEFVSTLKGLVMQGYVSADASNFRSFEEIKKAAFHINSGYARDLREALNPQKPKKSRRVRRE